MTPAGSMSSGTGSPQAGTESRAVSPTTVVIGLVERYTLYSGEEPAQDRLTVEPSSEAESSETELAEPRTTSSSSVSESPMSSITVSATVCTPPGSSTSITCPDKLTPLTVQNQVTTSPSESVDALPSKLDKVPGIRISGEVDQAADGGRLAIVTSWEADEVRPHGSLAMTVTLHV